jgi:1-acyl-sn-glycerol-3-phosphate acyltransferase
MKNLLRILFVMLLARPVVRLWLGLTVRHQERLPSAGPAIVIANHNSHLDILALYSLFPLALIPRVRPAAAADYFLKNRWMAWFATNVVGIIPVVRGGVGSGRDPLAGCRQALAAGEILVLFPEGTRGEPEALSEIKSGIWYLLRDFPDIPVVPVYLHGLGRAMGRGQWLPVLLRRCRRGALLCWQVDKDAFRTHIRDTFLQLKQKTLPAEPDPNNN